MIISGYASVFNVVDTRNDIVERTAFDNIVQNNYIPLYLNHEHGQVVGKILEHWTDINGFGIIAVIDINYRDRIRNYNHLSFAYRVLQSRRDQNTGIRYLMKIELIEISIIKNPEQLLASFEIISDSLENYQFQHIPSMFEYMDQI